MATNRRGPVGRGRTKQSRDLIRQVTDAGGTVTVCANGHLRIVGPGGIAVVGSDPKGPRAWRNVLTSVRRYAGLVVAMPN